MNSYTRLRSNSCDRFYAALRCARALALRLSQVSKLRFSLFCPWVLGDPRMRISEVREISSEKSFVGSRAVSYHDAELITYNYNPATCYQIKEHHREKDQHVIRRSVRPRNHGSIGPGPEPRRVQWRDWRYYHWFSRYSRIWRPSRWPDLGDPGPSSRSEGGRAHPGRGPGSPSGRRQWRRK
jgi:hypothetical protein